MTLWLVLLVVLALLVIGGLAFVVRAAHRLPDGEPLEQDPHDIAAPLPVETVRDDRGRRRRRAA